jgi:hypothetical protein
MPKVSIIGDTGYVQIIAVFGRSDADKSTSITGLTFYIAKRRPTIWLANRMPEVAIIRGTAYVEKAVTGRTGHIDNVAPVTGLTFYVTKRIPTTVRLADGMPEVAIAGDAANV